MAENVDYEGNGWMISNCLHLPGFPNLFWRELQYFGHTEPPTYVGKQFHERGESDCTIHVAVPTNYAVNPAWEAWTVSVTGSDIDETWDAAALCALTQFCEEHKHEVAGTPFAYLPIRDQSDPEWRLRMDFVNDVGHPSFNPYMAMSVYHSASLYPLYCFQRTELNIYREAVRESHDRTLAREQTIAEKDAEIAALKEQLWLKDEEIEEIDQERANAQDDAELFESMMIEAQDDLEEFKAAHLPRLVQGEVIPLKQGEQVNPDMEE